MSNNVVEPCSSQTLFSPFLIDNTKHLRVDFESSSMSHVGKGLAWFPCQSSFILDF